MYVKVFVEFRFFWRPTFLVTVITIQINHIHEANIFIAEKNRTKDFSLFSEWPEKQLG
jgi:hypothetical protein